MGPSRLKIKNFQCLQGDASGDVLLQGYRPGIAVCAARK
jgi:hypothetical protein